MLKLMLTLLLLAGFALPAAAQTAPASGWDQHVAGCFPSAPNGVASFDWLSTPWYAKRVVILARFGTTPISRIYDQLHVAYWRQDCPNNVQFPLLMLRFERIDRTNGTHVGVFQPHRPETSISPATFQHVDPAS